MADSNLSGQAMGAKGRGTRQRLLEVTRRLLSVTALRDLRAADIARQAHASKATFYLYFQNVEAVALALAEEAALASGPVLEILREDWRGLEPSCCDRFIAAYFDYWDQHRAVLRVQNLAASAGDPAFQDVRLRLSAPLHTLLAGKIEAVSSKLPGHAPTLAAVILGGFERNADNYPNYPARYEVTRARLLEASSVILQSLLVPVTTGSTPAPSAEPPRITTSGIPVKPGSRKR